MENNKSEILIYKTNDGLTRVEVQLEQENVWLSKNQMAELFQTTRNNITKHINNCYEEKELNENSLLVQKEGNRKVSRKVKKYNLDVIISIGYRVKSLRGTQFII